MCNRVLWRLVLHPVNLRPRCNAGLEALSLYFSQQPDLSAWCSQLMEAWYCTKCFGYALAMTISFCSKHRISMISMISQWSQWQFAGVGTVSASPQCLFISCTDWLDTWWHSEKPQPSTRVFARFLWPTAVDKILFTLQRTEATWTT